MRHIWTVWKKEMRDTLRDRRTLMSMVVMPMAIIPLLMVGMSKLTVSQVQKMAEQRIRLAVENQNAAPELVALLAQEAKADVVQVEGPIAVAVREGRADVGVVIPADFQSKLEQQQPVQINVLRNSTQPFSLSAAVRVEAGLELFNERLIEKRFVRYGVNPSINAGVRAITQEVASQKQRDGFGLGLFLPLFILMWSLIGGQYTAIDASAGERERKTLVALLVTPAKRIHIVLGKFLAVAAVSLSSVTISLVSMFFAVRHLIPLGIPMRFSVDIHALAWIFVVSFLLVLMFSALLLSLGIFAKTFKEAQSYISPLYMVFLLPVAVTSVIPGWKPSALFFLLPGMNAMLLFKEIFVGVYDPVHIASTVGVLGLGALLAVGVAVSLYQKESVLLKG